jgi:DNA repair protein RAD50
MSTIQKLAIAGVRSYNPETIQKIEFFSPITLILGENGAGKTVNSFHLIIDDS